MPFSIFIKLLLHATFTYRISHKSINCFGIKIFLMVLQGVRPHEYVGIFFLAVDLCVSSVSLRIRFHYPTLHRYRINRMRLPFSDTFAGR